MALLYGPLAGLTVGGLTGNRNAGLLTGVGVGAYVAGQRQAQGQNPFFGGRRRSKRWVQKSMKRIMPKKRGSFSRKAARARRTTHAFACSVLRSPQKFSPSTVRQANFFRNINRSHRC